MDGGLQPVLCVCNVCCVCNVYRECHRCYRDSEDELAPTLAAHNEPSSRSGRKIQPPKTLEYLDSQVRATFIIIVVLIHTLSVQVNKTAKKARGKNKK